MKKSKFVMKKRYIVLISILLTLVVAFVVVDTFFFPLVNGLVPRSSAYISIVEVTEKEITFGFSQNTSMCIASHFKLKEKDGILFVYFKGGYLTGGLGSMKEPNIVKVKNKYGDIKEIRVADKDGSDLVWSIEQGMLKYTIGVYNNFGEIENVVVSTKSRMQ